MIFTGNMLWLILLLPVLGAMLSLIMPSPAAALRLVAAGVPLIAAVDLWAVLAVFSGGTLTSGGEWLRLDALSGYHAAVMALVFSLSSLYASSYFRRESAEARLARGLARRFAALWYGALAAMTLVLLSNNLGIMWVGVEATTLLTAFLICLHVSAFSLEATWKYLIVCSVGVAFAFMGVLLLAASAGTPEAGAHLLDWTYLRKMAGSLDARLVKLSFIFLLVGYGTKAGVAPMHSWLPDAHSQAPAPVSALFSGFMLNMALYCIMRYMPLADAAIGYAGWLNNMLIVFGLVSILIAAVFILSQHDLKRLLAYCSVEHIGIIMLGLGLGPLGVFAALFHTLNHSLSKALGFFAAGRLGQIYGSLDMRRIKGAVHADPLWGAGLFGGILALIGVAPFAVFMSELLILKAAADARQYVVIAVFLLGTGTVFVGVLRQAVNMCWGEKPGVENDCAANGLADWLIVLAPMLVLVALGLWMPPFFRSALEAAAGILAEGGL